MEAARLSKRIDDGFDPMGERRKSREDDRLEPTLADMAKEYLEHHCIPNNRPGSLRNNRSLLDGIILPRFGEMRLSEFHTRNLEKLKADLKATPYRANRVLALVSHMFSKVLNAKDTDKDWAKWKQWVEGNPAHGIPRYDEQERERFLTPDEMRAFVRALDAYGESNPSAANALRLLMLTGAREGEVLKSQWTEFDLERGVWVKPSHHTKQKRVEHVNLSDQALEILRAMQARGATGPLFPGREKGARATLRRPWVQVCKLAGLCEAIQRKGKRRMITRYKPTVRIHDLRHNYASYLVSNGQSLETVGRLLGHTQVATTKRYSHLMDAPQRAATNVFGRIYEAASKPEGESNASTQTK
jgi:integrase